MKVTKSVMVETEVEVDIGVEDINLVFTESGDYANPNLTRILGTNLSQAVQFLDGIPIELIAAQTPGFRSIAANALKKIAMRFEDNHDEQSKIDSRK